MIKKYTADFETSTWCDERTWVWAYAICEIGNPENIEIGNDINDFMIWCEKEKNSKIYFHNLKFDRVFYIILSFK